MTAPAKWFDVFGVGLQGLGSRVEGSGWVDWLRHKRKCVRTSLKWKRS